MIQRRDAVKNDLGNQHDISDGFVQIVERVRWVGVSASEYRDRRHFLHAYIACLSFEGLCAAIVELLDSPSDVRRALRSRLLRILGDGLTDGRQGLLDTLVIKVSECADQKKMPCIRSRYAVLCDFQVLVY